MINNENDQISLEFSNIGYSVKKKKSLHDCLFCVEEETVILKDISGKFLSNDFVCIMGPSGSGKTSLLNILSHRVSPNKGTVKFNRKDVIKSSQDENYIGYIQQHDLFYSYLTVKEHLCQQNSAYTLNGTTRGISGGEKKRLSIASELLTNPSIIFADEPTSGLDTYMSMNVIDSLKKLADDNQIVVCTIHQPSSYIFFRFTKIMLLYHGEVLFFGPIESCVPYFMRLGYICPIQCNPADFLISIVTVDDNDQSTKHFEIKKLTELWKNSNTIMDSILRKDLNVYSHSSIIKEAKLSLTSQANNFEYFKSHSAIKKTNVTESYNVSKKITFDTLLQRSFLVSARNPTDTRFRLIQVIFTSIFTSFVYLRLKDTSFQSKAGACFFLIVNNAFTMSFGTVFNFMTVKEITIRERDTGNLYLRLANNVLGLYSLSLYFAVVNIADFCFIGICWFMIGFNDTFWRFLVASGYYFMLGLASMSVGYIAGAISPHIGVASALCPVLLLPFTILSGFVVQKRSLSTFWTILYYISPYSHCFSALMRCIFDTANAEAFPFNSSENNDTSTLLTKNTILSFYSIENTTLSWIIDMLVLLLWILFGRLLALCLFLYLNQRPKLKKNTQEDVKSVSK